MRGADALADHDWHAVPARLVAENLQGLSGEKAEALRHILGPQGLAILDGQAGTGKSTVLAAGKEIYEADGCRVIGLAHTNLVVQDLKGKGFDARTIDSELYSLANGRTQWTARTVVMVDEAAMVDTRRLGMIFAHAHESGAKVVLAGDDRQLSSIERGGLFEVLKARHGFAELIEVRRQNATDERAASQAMARGDFAGALATYSSKGAIHWTEKQSEAATALVQKYMQDSADNPLKTRFIFTHRNAEVDQINAVVREARKARFELGESASFETKHGRAEFAPGDRLQFTATDKQRGIYNGQAGTVKEIDRSRFIVELNGRKKAAVAFDAAAFKDFRHGYAGTIYRGQGRTLDQTYLYHSEHWRNATSYVALTRHSEKTELFVARETASDLPELARQMSRLDERRAASYYAQHDRTAKPLRDQPMDTIRLYRGIGNNVWPSEHGEALFFSTDPARAAAFGELHYVDVTTDEMAKFERPHSKRILEQEPIAKNDLRTADAAIIGRLKKLSDADRTQQDRTTKPLGPAELAAWYANLDNYSRQIRTQPMDANRGNIRYNAPMRNEAPMDQVLSDLGRSDQAVSASVCQRRDERGIECWSYGRGGRLEIRQHRRCL